MREDIRQYIDFLKFCLGDNEEVPQCVKTINWHNLLLFAKKQTIKGMFIPTLFLEDGKLTKEDFGDNKPTDEDIMEWMFEKQRLLKANKKMYESTYQLSKRFIDMGLRNCILKGQGNSINYKNPYMRAPGDIDIWVEGGEEKIVQLMEPYCNVDNRTKIHLEFTLSNKVPVEVHFRPSYLLNPFLDKKLVKWFDTVGEEQFSNMVSLEGVVNPFYAPTNYFNLFYQLLHMHRHLIKRGIGLRHIIDYYYLLKKRMDEVPNPEKDKELLSLLKRFRLLKFAKAMLYVEHKLLGLDKEYLYTEPDEEEGLFVLNEAIEGGNFGYSDTRLKNELNQTTGHFKRFLVLESYNFRLLKHYPSETIWMPVQDLIDHFSRRKKNVE